MSDAIAPQAYLTNAVAFDLSPAIEGLTRCNHDMIDDWCSWCAGLPEVGEEDCE